jgi:hypothetical protein
LLVVCGQRYAPLLWPPSLLSLRQAKTMDNWCKKQQEFFKLKDGLLNLKGEKTVIGLL